MAEGTQRVLPKGKQMTDTLLTAEQILALPAGPALDQAVAEYVLGWQWLWWKVAAPSGECVRGLFPPDYDNPYHYLQWTQATGDLRITTMNTGVPAFSTSITDA